MDSSSTSWFVCDAAATEGLKSIHRIRAQKLHFRMADKQQHLVTFWCSYGGFNPLLRAAPCWWLQQTGTMTCAGTQMGLFLQESQDISAKKRQKNNDITRQSTQFRRTV